MTETLQKTENVTKNIANKKLQLLEQVSAFELRDQLQIKDMRISKLKEKNAEPRNVWGFDTFEVAQQYADLFGGHVEITRPDGQFDLFNN